MFKYSNPLFTFPSWPFMQSGPSYYDAVPKFILFHSFTGKSFSEALILVSTNPQYDKRLFIELQVQYMKIESSEHGEIMGRTCCVHKLF